MSKKTIFGSLNFNCIPGEFEYTVILPPEYNKSETLPLLLYLHGFGGSRDEVVEFEQLFRQLWKTQELQRMVIASFSAKMSFYLNYFDRSQLWEDALFEFTSFIRAEYNTRSEPEYNYLTGISMGGRGALRLGFKFPECFGAVAAMEAGIDPALDYSELQPRNNGVSTLDAKLQASLWGWPVDADFYRANNIASIANDNAEKIRKSGLKIFFECGDHDALNFHDGAEYLHRLLWGERIEHEYRSLHDCDHVGSSLRWRSAEMFRWLGRTASKLISPESFNIPEPTPQQLAFLSWKSSGDNGEPPLDSEPFGMMDDAMIGLLRHGLSEERKRFSEAPLDGVFRKAIDEKKERN